MKSFARLVNKKRAISPVIAVILLIGLAVAAAAAIFLIVLPLFEPSSNLQMDDAYVVYDDEYTTAADLGEGYGKGTLVLSNTGTADIDIVSLEVYYASTVLGPWIEITNHEGLLITQTNPYTIETLATLDELDVRFLIPEENNNNSIFYRITLRTSDGDELDTATEGNIAETDMQLEKDRPDISYATTSMGSLRREEPIRPTQVTDNSEIKNVIYEIYFENGTLVPGKTKTIEPPSTLWQWTWDTRNDPTERLDNGSYYMIMTVNDYAGLSKKTGEINFTIDNDYIDPVITNIVGASVKNGLGVAEVGEFYSINASITDTGCQVSAVKEAYLYYKLNDTDVTTYSTTKMNKGSGDTYYQNIPAGFIDTEALDDNITFYITAEDDDTNENTSSDEYAGVLDTSKPNIETHYFDGTLIQNLPQPDTLEGTETPIWVTVTDKDSVELVTLVYREYNDTGTQQINEWKTLTNTSGTGDTWNFTIPSANVTLDGFQYFINTTDPTGNIAYGSLDGSASSPYYVEVPDQAKPNFEFLSNNQQPPDDLLSEGADLNVRIRITDNDFSFSWTGHETGSGKLRYKFSNESFYREVLMDHYDIDSKMTGKGDWSGTIGGLNFTILTSPLDIQIVIKDKADNDYTYSKEVTVVSADRPTLEYGGDKFLKVQGSSNHGLTFRVNNSATKATADADIMAMQVELRNRTKPSYIGEPLLVKINITAGTVWTNSSNPSEGANNTKITLDTPFQMSEDSSIDLSLIFANSSGGYFDINDFSVNLTIFFDWGPVTDDHDQISFKTPTTTFLFFDDFEGGIGNWLEDSRKAPSTSFTAVTFDGSQTYRGDSTSGSGREVWSWINTKNFELPFEIVLRFWAESTGTNRMAYVGMAETQSASTIYCAGARVGANNGRIQRYTVGGSFSNLGTSINYVWGENEWNWMKVNVSGTGLIRVFSLDLGQWEERAYHTEPSLTSSGYVYVCLMLEYARTYYDDVTIYYSGDAPDNPAAPSPILSISMNDYLEENISSVLSETLMVNVIDPKTLGIHP